MSGNLKSEHVSENKNATILVVFGGNQERRDDIINLLMTIENLSIYGTLSEEAGIEKIKELGKVDIVLIGGRYTGLQRDNIKNFINKNYPTAHTTEPGIRYLYSNENIFNEINNLTKDEATSKI